MSDTLLPLIYPARQPSREKPHVWKAVVTLRHAGFPVLRIKANRHKVGSATMTSRQLLKAAARVAPKRLFPSSTAN